MVKSVFKQVVAVLVAIKALFAAVGEAMEFQAAQNRGNCRADVSASAVVRLCLSLLLLSVPGLAAAEKIDLVLEHGVLMVPARINDAVTLPFILDSGASHISMPEDVFKTLLRTRTVTESDFRGEVVVVTADGSKHLQRRFILHEVRVGSHVVKDVVASVAPDKADPLLGQSFLGKLQGWRIDNTSHALVIDAGAGRPPAGSSANQTPELAAVEVIRSAVDRWEASIMVRDPDYALLSGAVRRYAQALLLERGNPQTPEQAIALTQAAYDEVKRDWGAFSKKPVPRY